MGADPDRLRAAVPHLTDRELADLSARAAQVKDVAAGHHGGGDGALILIGVLLLVAGHRRARRGGRRLLRRRLLGRLLVLLIPRSWSPVTVIMTDGRSSPAVERRPPSPWPSPFRDRLRARRPGRALPSTWPRAARRRRPGAFRVGPLRYLGGLWLRSPDARFGGLSDLRVSATGPGSSRSPTVATASPPRSRTTGRGGSSGSPTPGWSLYRVDGRPLPLGGSDAESLVAGDEGLKWVSKDGEGSWPTGRSRCSPGRPGAAVPGRAGPSAAGTMASRRWRTRATDDGC